MFASADWNTARYLTGEDISSNTRSVEPSPFGSGPDTGTATAGRWATAAVTARPVSGATVPVDRVGAAAVVR